MTHPGQEPATTSANRNLAARVATALVAVPLLLLLIYRAPSWALLPLTTIAAMLGTHELLGMTHRGDGVAQVWGVLLSAAVSLLFYFAGHDSRLLATLLVVVPSAGLVFTLFRLGDMATAAHRAFALSLAPLLVGIPLTLLAVLRRDAGPGYVLLCLVTAWFSDTGGYFAGRFLGKTKLYPAVSPKKTVEGALGGLLASVLGGGVVGHFWFVPGVPLANAIGVALVAAALGQVGDLTESLIKRSTGVKDSGSLIPGHGGILDRVDAVLLTTIVVYLYTVWFSPAA